MKKRTQCAARLLRISLLCIMLCGSVLAQTTRYAIRNSEISKNQDYPPPVRTTNTEDPGAVTIRYSLFGFDVSDMKINQETFQILQAEGFGLELQTGAPSLPVRTEKIILPSNSKPSLSVTESEFVEIEGFYIVPAREMPSDHAGTSYSDLKTDSDVYSVNSYFPGKLVSLADIQMLRGVPLALIKINPVQYNPVTRTTRIYSRLSVKIQFTPSISTHKTIPSANGSGAVLNNIVLNPAKAARATAAAVEVPEGYIVVTVPELEDAAGALAQWKRQLGYKTYILSQPAWTISQVKNAVQNIYHNVSPPPSYLVILGDQQHVPDYYYENNYLDPVLPVYSTNYYACMDGPDDFYPEMAHGRISVKDAAQAMLVVNKIADYERTPPSDPSFYQKGLHAGYFQDSARDGISDKRYAKTTIEMYEYMENLGFQSDLILFTESDVTPASFNPYYSGNTIIPSQYLKQNGFPWDGDKHDIIASLNDGRFYAFHRDHGKMEGWIQPQIDIGDLNNLQNGNEVPVVFSINCASGLFVKPEPVICFSEKLLRHPNGGAVGVVSATEETRSGYNDGLITGMLDAVWPNPGLLPDLGNGGEPNPDITPHAPIYAMGDVMLQGLIRMTETWDPVGWADKDHFHLYHYFGDPAMKIRTAPPVAVTASHPQAIDTGAISIQVTGINCPDALLSVCYQNELKALYKAENGSGTLYFPEPLTNQYPEIIVTISKHNHIPYVARIPVNPQTSPDPRINIMPLGNSLTFDEYQNETRPVENRAGYRKHLYDLLTEFGTEFNFVGSKTSGDAVLADPENAGFPGMTSSQILYLLRTGYNQREAVQETNGYYLDAYAPDIILLHAGTNGFTTDISVLSEILDEIENYKIRTGKDTKTVLAQIINRSPLHSETTVYNSNIQLMAASRNDNSVFLADMEQESGLIYEPEPAGDMHDMYHPKPEGYNKMSQIWMNGISDALGLTQHVPVLLGVKDMVLNTGERLYMDFHALATEKPVFTLTNGSATMQFDPDLGILSWTADEAGDFHLTVTAQNSYGSASENMHIQVLNEHNAGYESIFSHSIAIPYLQSNSTTMPVTGFVNSVTVYHGGGSGKLVYALYDNKNELPDRLLAQTAPTDVNSAPGWQTVPLTSPLPVNAGEIIWMAWMFENSISVNYDPGTPGRARSWIQWQHGLPGTFSVTSTANYTYSVYMSYSPENSTPTVPSAPSGLTASYDTGVPEITLNWTDNANNESGFTIERSLNSGSFNAIAGPGANTTAYTDSGIEYNQIYAYRVYASNAAGNSAFSDTVQINTGDSPGIHPPAAPENIRAQLISGNLIEVSWTDGSDNETGFEAERALNGGAFIPVATTPPDEELISDAVPQTGVNYTYRVRAFNAAGASAFIVSSSLFVPGTSDESIAGYDEVFPSFVYNDHRRAQLITMPGDGTIRTISMYHGGGGGSVLLAVYSDNGNAPDHRLAVTPVTPVNSSPGWQEIDLISPVWLAKNTKVWLSWIYEYSPAIYYENGGPGRAHSEDVWSAQMPASYGPFSVAYYTYSIHARYTPDAIGPVPTAPSGLSYVYDENAPSVSLSWSDNSDNEAGFTVERALNSGPFEILSVRAPDENAYTDYTVAYSQTYAYRILAFNTNGDSDYSNTIAVFTDYTPLPPPANPDALTAVFDESIPNITLNWSDNSTDEEGFTIQRKTNAGVYTDLANVNANQNTYADHAIAYNQIYEYRVYAFRDSVNSGFSNTVQINTDYTPAIPPDAPTSLSAAYDGSVPAISLNWIDNSDQEEGFVIEKEENTGGFGFLEELPANQTNYTDPAVAYNQDYAYRVYAYNRYGNSSISNTAVIHTTEPSEEPIQVGFTDVLPMKVNTCYRRAQPVIIPEDGTIESVSMFHDAATGNLLFGIYDDSGGLPGNLLGTTPVTPNAGTSGWQSVALVTPVEVTSGQKVWMAWVFTHGTHIYYNNGVPGRAHSGVFWTGPSLPSNFGPATVNDYIYSVYLTLNPQGINKSEESNTERNNAEAGISILPNPIRDGIVNFSVSGIKKDTDFTLEIFDVTGRILMKKKVRLNSNQFYSLELGNNLTTSLLIIKLHNRKINLTALIFAGESTEKNF